jgi:hypothetical protein
MATWTARDIMDSIDEGKLRLAERKAEYEAEALRQLDEQNAKIDAAWEPIIARIKESIPEWAWQYLTNPRQMPSYRKEHVSMIRPARIDLQGMGIVFVYVDGQDVPMFVPVRWYLADDEEKWSVRWYLADDEEKWSVQTHNGYAEIRYSLPGDPDFLIALAQAYDNMAGYAELQVEADRRNAERRKAKVEPITPEPPSRAEHDWVGLARLAVGEAREGGNQAAIAYALIGILEQLQKMEWVAARS